MTLDKTRKKTPNFFSMKSLPFFSEVRVFNNLVGPKRCCYNFYSKGQNSQWTLRKCSLSFVTFDNTKKNGPKILPFWKMLFSPTFVSFEPLCPKEMILSFAYCMSNHLLSFYKKFPDIWHIRYYGKNEPKSFLPWKVCIFSGKFVFSTTLRS